MNAIISSIPKFTETKKQKKQKAASTLQKVRAIRNRLERAQNRARAEIVGWSNQGKLKNQIIELREMGVSYIDISDMTGASLGYVRNLCWEIGMKNDEIQNKR